MKTIPTLITDRLILRQLLKDDVDELFLLRSSDTTNKYLNRRKCEKIEEVGSFIDIISREKMYYWAILPKGSKKLVGTVCLFDFSEQMEQCEIGFELMDAYHKQGIMTEAVSKVIEYSSRTLKLKTLIAISHPANQNSLRLLTRLNFALIEDSSKYLGLRFLKLTLTNQ